MRESATPRMADPVSEPAATRPATRRGVSGILVRSITVHRGHVFPVVYACDCHGIGCEVFLDDIAEYVVMGGAGRHADISQGGWYVGAGFTMYGGAR